MRDESEFHDGDQEYETAAENEPVLFAQRAERKEGGGREQPRKDDGEPSDEPRTRDFRGQGARRRVRVEFRGRELQERESAHDPGRERHKARERKYGSEEFVRARPRDRIFANGV